MLLINRQDLQRHWVSACQRLQKLMSLGLLRAAFRQNLH